MLYLILWLILAAWTYYDASKRKNKPIMWAILTFLFGVIALPVYFAKRNLKPGEVREGGTAWNVLKNFALFWTLTMAVVGISGFINASRVVSTAKSGAEAAGAAIGTGIGMTMIFFLWFFPMIIALILGFFMKKSSIVEKGPTGGLSQ